MKKISVVFVLMVVTISFALAQTKATTENKTPKPAMVFESGVIHDFGTLKRGADATFDFVFKNMGKDAIVVSEVKTSCGCTAPSWSKEPVLKKKNGTVTVKYNTNNMGRFTKTITVISNADNSPVQLTITGNVAETTEESK